MMDDADARDLNGVSPPPFPQPEVIGLPVVNRGTRFLDFLDLYLDWQKNYKTKVKKAFFFFSCLSMRKWVLGPKKGKKSLEKNRVQKFLLFKWVDLGMKKIRNFALISKWEFCSSSYQKYCRLKHQIFIKNYNMSPIVP
jgi:hypothetical protein